MTYEDPRDQDRETLDDPQTTPVDENKTDQPEKDETETTYQYTDWASI
ncbi:MAG: hypothetical protein KUG58_05860 [Marinosulfonomonas sp.]|nr:hypothetical protein [Marinosulfonomonas sp.]